MWDNVIGRHLKRTAWRLLGVNLVLVVVVLVVYGACSRYLFNFLFGPFPVDIAALVDETDPASRWRYYITVASDTEFVCGTEKVRQTDRNNPQIVVSETVKAQYRILLARQPAPGEPLKFLLVKAEPNAPAKRYTGTLVAMPPDVLRDIVIGNENREPKLKDLTLRNIMLDATGFRTAGWFLLGIGVPVLLLGLFNVLRAVRRLRHPEYHPAVLALAKLGPPADLLSAIDRDFRAVAEDRRHLAPLEITRHWIMAASYYGLQVAPLTDVIWMYKKQTKHSVNFVPTGSTYAVVVQLRSGRTLEVQGKLKRVDGWLQEALVLAPWILIGFDNQLLALWQNERGELIRMVDQRREQMSGGSPPL